MPLNCSLAALALLFTATSACAHPGQDAASFAAGFAHPFAGLDHLLAMLAVGLYAATRAGTMRWALPATFVVAMLGGAGIGATGLALPAVEAGIAASVLVLGLLIAFMVRLPLAAALPLVALFALLHGHAHHAEMGSSALATYAAGFVIASAILHGIGLIVARWLPATPIARAGERAIGALIAGTGVVLLGT